MHQYLRAIGFSEIKSHKEVENLLLYAEEKPDKVKTVQTDTEECSQQTYTKFGKRIGISTCGILDENDNYYREFYFPYLIGDQVSTQVECGIQKHAEKDSYSGICDEYKIGVSLIFYLQNGTDYYENYLKQHMDVRPSSVILCGLSIYGEILLPVKKTDVQDAKIKLECLKRNRLYEAAKQGSESAIETLAMEDMNLFSRINDRINNEDIYSIVDTCFLPYGVECDHYSIVGEIMDMDTDINEVTGEEIYEFTLECNTLIFKLCINKIDLLGEPAIGRRFKGIIWMQGHADFSGDM